MMLRDLTLFIGRSTLEASGVLRMAIARDNSERIILKCNLIW
ncbi:MAG TPA: hypothetical protein V6C84_29645 [Coleofasciculaceae cyanobacterium]